MCSHENYEEQAAIEFYRQMYLIRQAEETILEAFSKGFLCGTTHTCIGQEACPVGVINALDLERDIIFSNHRCHGHLLVYRQDLIGLFGELLGKDAGICCGVGGSQHLNKDSFYSNGIQGGIVPCATGMAFAEKVKGTGAIVVTFLGDGTFGQGVVYESFNMASLWSLPVLYVVEHNRYAQSTPTELQLAGSICARADAFGIDVLELPAEDVFAVHDAAREAVSFVRGKGRPFCLILHTYRFSPHSKGDDFRDPAEIDSYRKKDPLIKLRTDIGEEAAGVVEKDVDKLIEEAYAEASKASQLEYSRFLRKEL